MKNPKHTSTASQTLTATQSRVPALKSRPAGMPVRTGIRAGWIGPGGGVGPGFHGVGFGRRGPGL